MKEQLFEILHNRKRMPGERFSDIEGKIENFVNQEVERRIAERMPSEEDVEINLASFDEITNDWFDFTHAVYHWLRSRLTPQVTPQDTPQVEKTEGGER